MLWRMLMLRLILIVLMVRLLRRLMLLLILLWRLRVWGRRGRGNGILQSDGLILMRRRRGDMYWRRRMSG